MLLIGQAVAMPASTTAVQTGLAATPTAHLALSKPLDLRHDDDGDFFDSTDVSFTKKLAAAGDSYTAGIGAGDRFGSLLGVLDPTNVSLSNLRSFPCPMIQVYLMCEDWACSRYDLAYPYLINNDPRLGDPSGRNFHFRACSGAVTKDVLENQIPSVDSDQQVVLLSIDRAESFINRDAFSSDIDKVLDAAKAKLVGDSGMIYHTGYGKFFGGDLCRSVTLCLGPRGFT
ncbi:hypothetical protein DL770_009068 [Monosporascus sp. CRB-9-2]|nr:hypothetical protein DL770_009068 [Monosporascus sp. CRB-9-2]